MKSKKTGWYKGNQKPVRDGVYERNYGGGSGAQTCLFALFKNGVWCVNAYTPRSASRQKVTSRLQSLPWRGLAENPNKKEQKNG